ncbi:MAG: hypothetical protein Q9220_003279 [cf. Caloplaca sp. 1 TL-2023]
MSGIHGYLMKVDDDKRGAEQVAKETAHSTLLQRNATPYETETYCALGLQAGQTSLIDIVQSLGDFINDEDPAIRSKAVTYLSHVIEALPDATLSRQHVQVLCQFLCDRIEDSGAMMGLTKLQSMGRFTKEMAITTLRALLEHFQDFMLRPHTQRLQILELLNELMLNHRAALRSVGGEAITGITDLVSGEKDPRSLMIIFSILHVLMVEWDISGHAEILFDSVYNYFPITFRPPRDDPFRITAQDLKDRLRSCIAASSFFAPFAFPQLIEKLDSTSPNVKKDVLQTLTSCASSYSVATISNYSVTLWDTLKYEILNVQEEDLAEDTLVTLQAIAIRLGKDLKSTSQTTHLARYLRPVTKECTEQLQEPQHKQAKPVGQILSTLATSSSIALYLIVKAVMPTLLTLYQDADSIANRRALLEVLVQIFNAAVALDKTPGVAPPPTSLEQPLLPFKDRIFELCSQALMSTASEEVSFRIVALQGLLRLCQVRSYLQRSEIGMVVQYLNEIVLAEDSQGRGDVRNEAIQALVEISQLNPSLIMDITFPAFTARLPDHNVEDSTGYLITLEGLARLSIERSISSTLIRRLLSKLENVLPSKGSASYAQALLSTIDYVLGSRTLSADPDLAYYHEKLVIGLLSRAALASVGSGPSILAEPMTLEVLGRLAAKIICALDEHKRKSVALETYTLFTEDGVPFTPILYTNGMPERQRVTMILSTWILASVGSADSVLYTAADDHNLDGLLNELTRLATIEILPVIRHSILRQIALLVNRCSSVEGQSYALKVMKDPFSASQIDSRRSFDAVPVVFWIAKALTLRLSKTQEVLDHVLGSLSDEIYGSASARGFGVLLAPDEILSKEYGASVRLLTRQKVFSFCVPRLAGDFKTAASAAKPNYLVALSGILKHVPTEVMMTEIPTLLPLLLQSLDLPDQEVKAATIESLIVVSQESPEAVESHMSSLSTRLLQSATDAKTNIPKVRYSALRCLQIFPNKIKDSVLLPLKPAIIRGVILVLDDSKRQVRRAAVECRAAWTNLGEPDAED